MISILDQFDLRAKKQNFQRDAFETIADMKAFSENYLPPIFDAYCYEDGKRQRRFFHGKLCGLAWKSSE